MLGIIFGAMIVMLILTVPIGVMLLVVSLIPSLISPGFSASIPFVLRNVVGGLNSTPLLAIPLFILGGIIMAQSGIAEKLFDVFAYLTEIKQEACLAPLLLPAYFMVLFPVRLQPPLLL